MQCNAMRGYFSAQPTTKTERLGITMLINDKSQLKRNGACLVPTSKLNLGHVSASLK